ncbi:uncharacterized protein N7482_002466 [Penicillium canariense]|uniref:Uncharacterized protein n=1 Tax=Penicillium canariense TaxID=189055 RepID=A0A9W9IFE7_9EURO|nr:uncharacterized protein N7482_002466 [Penicillium canariense]KAJ5176589.1 hypothetical protein N7482_002466 [Penicillium canariense]
MKPVVSALNAWSCVVISLFAIVILSVLGSLYGSNNHSFTGSEGEPEDGPAVAASIYVAVIVYAVRHPEFEFATTSIPQETIFANMLIHKQQGFFVFCGFQAYLHMRDSRGGAISLR